MKKIISLTLMLIIGLTLNAQINTNIWGLTLGKSTKQQVKSVLKKKGYQCVVTPQGNYSINLNNTKFGGGYWSYAEFSFHKNILYNIGFLNDANRSVIDVDNMYEKVKQNLMIKYGEYYYSGYEGATPQSIAFFDKKTWIFLDLENSYPYRLVITYLNNKIGTIINDSELDEL